MSQTVVGFFDDQSDVEKAIEELQSEGISRDRIDVSRDNRSGTLDTSSRTTTSSDVNPVSGSERDENSVRKTADDRTVDPDGRNTNAFTDFFNNLFGKSDNDDAGRFSHVAGRSGAVVTVHAESREEAEIIAEILDDCGAVDVNERASQSGYTSSSKAADDSSGLRSRIFDKRLEENQRLRNWDSDTDL